MTLNRNTKIRMATVWLGGCAGCHMSFLDLDERLIEIFGRVDLVYSPIFDIKAFPRTWMSPWWKAPWPTRTT